MRIQSINGFASMNLIHERNETAKFSHPNFGATLDVNKLKEMPLEKKLSYMFSSMNTGDIIAVGKNFEEIHKGLNKAIEGFNNIIKRIFL